MTDTVQKPLTLLIAALGGEGGGVLTSWLVNAAREHDLPVQATSIPGVAQRTGATTYYIEIWPTRYADMDGRQPVLSLYPAAGEVDIVAATELMEAGRCIQNGFVTPDRTHLIASTHRVYTTIEKLNGGDGRYAPETLRSAAEGRARNTVLADMGALAAEAGTVINSVMLGAIAGSGLLPFQPDTFEAAIEAEGKAVAANLAGFRAGLAAANTQPAAVDTARDIITEATRRLTGYQDQAYADLYAERLGTFDGQDAALKADVARHLAHRMAYDDVIRVAQLKRRQERLARVRAEAKAGMGDPVRLTEFLKPGLAEVCDVLPKGLAQRLLKRAENNPDLAAKQWPIKLRTDTVGGHLRLWALSKLKRWRRGTYRYGLEQAAIEAWLDDIRRAAKVDVDLAREVAGLARLIKGYGDTHRRGHAQVRRIRDRVLIPALNGDVQPAEAASTLREEMEASLAKPEG